MTQLTIRAGITSRWNVVSDDIKAATTPEEKMRIALENIRDAHAAAQHFFYMKESWDKVAEAVEWIDVYEDLTDFTQKTAALALEA